MTAAYMVTRDRVPGSPAPFNLNADDGSHFVEDGQGHLLIAQEWEVKSETREYLHHEIDTARRLKGTPWTVRVHVVGESKAQAVALAQEVLAAMFHQSGEWALTVTDGGVTFPYGCKSRSWAPVLDNAGQWWAAGRLTIDVTVQVRLLPGHPFRA